MIHQMELQLLRVIDWHLNVPTVCYWLGSYLRLLIDRITMDNEKRNSNVMHASHGLSRRVLAGASKDSACINNNSRWPNRLNIDAIDETAQFVLQLADAAAHTPLFVLYPYSMIVAAALWIRLQDGIMGPIIHSLTNVSLGILPNR
jgi:hypothetical protein